MTLVLSLITLTSLVCVHAQQNDKGTSMIPFPRIGRADPTFFMEGKRVANSNPGLIPFPRIGRGGDGLHEMKRQLIPFPRVGKRPYWRLPVDTEYEEYTFPLMEVPAMSGSDFGVAAEETDAEKRSGAGNPSNNNNNGGMWFGPRLGRRKRSVETESSHDVDPRLLFKILHNFNWAIVPLKERRNFTPRLGRSSSEENPLSVEARGEPYTPRLGRSREQSSGDADDEGYNRHRYSRGKNFHTHKDPEGQSEEVGGVPFSPRLGRDHMNPRLGRSSTDEHE